MKPWMFGALLGILFGLSSRRWLAVDVGYNQTFEHPNDSGTTVVVIVGLGNTVNFNSHHSVPTLPSHKESSDAESA